MNVALKTVRSRERHILSGDSEEFEAGSGGTDGRDRDEELDERLWLAIAELNEAAAQILILRYVHNYSLSEIAGLLGTSRSTVAVSLFRSRARLKKLIRQYEGGPS